MSETETSYEMYKIVATLVGATLSIFGGFTAVIIRSRVEKRDEIGYIKIGLTDELEDICTIIGKLQETFNSTNLIGNNYLNDLSANTESYLHHKQRLFLIQNEVTRRSIVTFYKKLDNDIKDSVNKVNTLGNTGEHEKIVSKLVELKKAGEQVKTNLKSYKYKAFWVF